MRVFYYFYFGFAIAWLISCPTRVTSVSRGTCKAHDKSGIFCMGHSYSARHNSEKGSRGREGEGSRGRKIIDQIFCLSALPQQPARQINRVATHSPLLLVPFICCCQANKQINSRRSPLFPSAMDHRQQQKQQQQQSSPAALSAENGLQLQLGIMLCIFDMAQTAADPLYILPAPLHPLDYPSLCHASS